MEKTRAPFGASMLVAIGWFGTLVAALAVGDRSLPDPPPQGGCPSFGCHWSLLDLLPAIVLVVGVPLLLVLMAVTAVVTRLRIPAALAGTLSALATVAVSAVGIALYAAVQ